MNLRNALVAGSAAVLASSASAQYSYVSPYSLTNQGATRNIAMGGASLALPHNPSAVFENPGALVFRTSLIDSSAATKRSRDTKSEIAELSRQPSEGREYTLSVLALENVALGAGYRTQTLEDRYRMSNSIQHGLETELTTTPFAASVRIFDQFGFGVSYLLQEVKYKRTRLEGGVERTVLASGQLKGSQLEFGSFFAASSNISVAAAYHGETIWKSKNGAPDTYFPSSTRLGIAYFIPAPEGSEGLPFQENMVSFDLHIFQFNSITGRQTVATPVVVSSDVNSRDLRIPTTSSEKFKIDTNTKYSPKLGLGTSLFRNDVYAARGLLGFYFEPALLENGSSRPHMTGGLELSAWFVTLKAALDAAKNYNTHSLSLSVALNF